MSICQNNGMLKNILNGDNIKHIISISDVIGGIKQIINIDDVNIIANYYTDNTQVPYVASKVNGVYTNCSLDSVNNKLKVVLEGYSMDNGILYCNLQISVPDPDFPDGYANYTRLIRTNVFLTDANQVIV